jgi:hypothetical protein
MLLSRSNSDYLQWLTGCLLIFAVFFWPSIVTGQEAAPLLHGPEVVPGKGLAFGVDKIANTFVFTGNADVDVAALGGTIRLVNGYRGVVFRTSTTAVRDDEMFQFSYEIPFSAVLTSVARASWAVSRDSRVLELGSQERLGGVGGVRYRAEDADAWIEAVAGIDAMSQIGQHASGFITALQGRARSLQIDEDWQMNGDMLLDYHRLDDDRVNSDVDMAVDITGGLGSASALSVLAGFTNLGRDFFSPLPGVPDSLVIESRAEQRANVQGVLHTEIGAAWDLNFKGLVSLADVARSFKAGDAAIPITNVERESAESIIDIDGDIGWRVGSTAIRLGGAIYRREEANLVVPVHDIEEQDLLVLREQEAQRDNSTLRTALTVRLSWSLSHKDSVHLDGTSWLLRYDTPSDQNYDDRDELSGIASITYSRAVSSTLSAFATIGGQALHTVFLNAERSASNNVNRVLRAGTGVVFRSNTFHMKPTFEVLANYTTYDFEGQGAIARSFSFRQISWRDSIIYVVTPRINLESQVRFRYAERASLDWGSFAESPENGTLEYLVKMLSFVRVGTAWNVGAGLRLYELRQTSLISVPGISGTATYMQFWAPETVVQYVAPSGSSLSLNGWYEMQSLSGGRTRNLPNLLLQARIAL